MWSVRGIDIVNFLPDILNLKESTSFVIRYVYHRFSDSAVFIYDFLICLVWRAAGVTSMFPSHLVWDGSVTLVTSGSTFVTFI